jgi:hypothetical protein
MQRLNRRVEQVRRFVDFGPRATEPWEQKSALGRF